MNKLKGVSSRLKAIDLFCGCGGISAGFRSAGFDILAGLDFEPRYISTFRKNFPDALALEHDVSASSPRGLMKLLGLRTGELDVLAGGPPCQGFSKNVPRKRRYLEDPRNVLVKSFLDHCEVLQPRFVLLENVAEMKNGFKRAYTDEILERLDAMGYYVCHGVLNAADYGVPQRRRRAFFVASVEGAVELPSRTHLATDEGGLFSIPGHVSVWEAIGDLPSLKHGEGKEVTEYTKPPSSEFQKLMRNGCTVLKNHVARFLRPTQHDRLASLKPGEGFKNLPDHLKTKGGYSGAYGRLTKEMVAPTITRWVFHPGSGRWGHPVDIRLLSIRETARIQAFQDDFEFVGTYVQRSGQLGNAVPPLLVQMIAENCFIPAAREVLQAVR